MDAELVRQRAEAKAKARARHSWRHTAVSALGPLTALAGLVWALIQPYRITMLDPGGHSFWYLAVQPPLLVMLAGAVFHFWVVPGLLADLEAVEERRDE
jgi:hypothetical protein